MKNELLSTIDKYGVDYTAEMMAEYVNQRIQSEDVATQFILEELEAASQGSQIAKQFVLSSGFDEDDYLGSMYNSFEEVDGVDGPQQTLLNYCSMLFINMELATELRIKTVDNIMRIWKLGKYASIDENKRLVEIVEKRHSLVEGIFANINNDLNDSIKEDHNIMILMAYGYTRRTVAAGLYLQGIFSRVAYEQASNIFKSLQLKTGQSIEFQEEAANQSNELLQSYNNELTRNFTTKITSIVELNQVESPYEYNKQFTVEEIFQFFSNK